MFLKIEAITPLKNLRKDRRSSLQGDPSHGLYAIRIIFDATFVQYGLQRAMIGYDFVPPV